MKSNETTRSGPDVRMNVKVSRRDFPMLTDEISSLPKGRRRTNRLAHLATLGLLWEQAVSPREGPSICAGHGCPGVSMPGPAGRGYDGRLPGDLLAALLDDGDAS